MSRAEGHHLTGVLRVIQPTTNPASQQCIILYANLTAYNAITPLIARGAAECKLMQSSPEAKPSAIIAVIARGEAEFNNWCNRIILAVRFVYYAT